MNTLEIHGISVCVALTTLVHIGTWVAAHGGVKGIFLALWRGSKANEQQPKP